MAQSIKLGNNTFLDASGVVLEQTPLDEVLQKRLELVESAYTENGITSYKTVNAKLPASSGYTYLVFTRVPTSATAAGLGCAIVTVQSTTIVIKYLSQDGITGMTRNNDDTFTISLSAGYVNAVRIYRLI